MYHWYCIGFKFLVYINIKNMKFFCIFEGWLQAKWSDVEQSGVSSQSGEFFFSSVICDFQTSRSLVHYWFLRHRSYTKKACFFTIKLITVMNRPGPNQPCHFLTGYFWETSKDTSFKFLYVMVTGFQIV